MKRASRKEYHKEWYKNNPGKRRDYLLKHHYGITPEDYDELLKKQMGGCAICHYDNDGKPLYVDHNHTTNKVRGLLCEKCNFGLGNFQDCVHFLEQAIEYLEKEPRVEKEISHKEEGWPE